jgi:DNA-binding transcriptional regulator YdaS (Cro superfamily)
MTNLESNFNSVRIAVERIGGPTKAANSLSVSSASVHSWINKERVADYDKAKLLSQLSGMPVQELRSPR